MTSLAAVHTAAAIVVRALGDAGVSAEVRVESDPRRGVIVRPCPSIDQRDWVNALRAVATETLGGADDLGGLGHIDDVPVTAEWEQTARLTVVPA